MFGNYWRSCSFSKLPNPSPVTPCLHCKSVLCLLLTSCSLPSWLQPVLILVSVFSNAFLAFEMPSLLLFPSCESLRSSVLYSPSFFPSLTPAPSFTPLPNLEPSTPEKVIKSIWSMSFYNLLKQKMHRHSPPKEPSCL